MFLPQPLAAPVPCKLPEGSRAHRFLGGGASLHERFLPRGSGMTRPDPPKKCRLPLSEAHRAPLGPTLPVSVRLQTPELRPLPRDPGCWAHVWEGQSLLSTYSSGLQLPRGQSCHFGRLPL